ncbi:MAG: NAD(P)/FAD-dependent oxidoreductase, partial [Acetobacteraceae bacterium]
VIIGTNAYSDALWPGLSESIVPMRGHVLVSRPLSDNARAAILPGRQPLTDTRHLFSGVRLLADGSLHVSSDGPAFGSESDAFRRKTTARIARLFPFLGKPEWSEAWSGWVAMTRDQFPHYHELAPGVFAALGYSGRGIAAASLAGRDLAALAGGGDRDTLTFPLSSPRPIPARAFAPRLLAALVWWYRLRDGVAARRA